MDKKFLERQRLARQGLTLEKVNDGSRYNTQELKRPSKRSSAYVRKTLVFDDGVSAAEVMSKSATLYSNSQESVSEQIDRYERVLKMYLESYGAPSDINVLYDASWRPVGSDSPLQLGTHKLSNHPRFKDYPLIDCAAEGLWRVRNTKDALAEGNYQRAFFCLRELFQKVEMIVVACEKDGITGGSTELKKQRILEGLLIDEIQASGRLTVADAVEKIMPKYECITGTEVEKTTFGKYVSNVGLKRLNKEFAK